MVRFLIRTVVMLAANAIGLLIAAIVLEGMDVQLDGFIIAVALFTVVVALATPFLASRLAKMGSAALGGVSLIATLVSLLITNAISDGFSIDGLGTWIAAAVIVWAGALIAAFVLPFLGLKKYLEEKRA
jgi:hypothetical protein